MYFLKLEMTANVQPLQKNNQILMMNILLSKMIMYPTVLDQMMHLRELKLVLEEVKERED